MRASPALLATLLPGLAFSATNSELDANALPLHPYAGIVSSEVKAHPRAGSAGVVHQGRIVVGPDNEDLPAPEKDRWARFAEALGPGRTALGRHRTYGWRNNDGTRTECIAPCYINCCVGSGGLPVVGQSGL